LQAETTALIAAMTTAPAAARQTLIDNTIISLKAAGLWTKLDVLWVLAAADNQAARLNWKNPGSLGLTVVNAPVFTADRGYTGDGSTAALTSTYSPSTFGGVYTLNAATIGCYVLTSGVSTNTALEVYFNNTGRIGRTSAQVPLCLINDVTNLIASNTVTNPNITSGGHMTASRTGASTKELWQNAAQIASSTTASTAVPASTTSIFGTSGQYSDSQISLVYAGALADADIPTIDGIIRTYLQGTGALASTPVSTTVATHTAQITALQAQVLTLQQWATSQGAYVTYQPESVTLFAAMTNAPTYARKQLIDTAIAALKADGIWSLLDVLWVMAAADTQVAGLNWKNPALFPLTVHGTPTFTADRGYTGDGTAAWINSPQYNPNTLGGCQQTLNSTVLGVYVRTSGVATNASVEVGEGSTTSISRNAANTAETYRACDATTTTFVTSPLNAHWSVRRSDASTTALWKNGVSASTFSTASTNVGNSTLTLLSNSTGTGQWSDSQISYAYAGAALSDTQMAQIDSVLKSYLTGVGA
jgi:hypothetical protein